MKPNIRLIYLYLFSFVGLLIVVIGAVQLVDLGLKVFVFQEADRYDYYAPPVMENGKGENEAQAKERAQKEQQRNRQRQVSNSIAMILVGAPLYLYHWKTIQKENKS